jgi:hypothetical protein
MTWVELLPCVSTMADKPCLVTDKKVWPDPAALMASTAMSIEPSYKISHVSVCLLPPGPGLHN